MKKITLLIITTLVVIGCSNNEITPIEPPAMDKLIGFSTMRDKVNTRYANDDKDNYEVYAIIEGADHWYFNTTVTPSSVHGAIDTMAEEYYWPGTQTVDFYAFCPDVSTNENIEMYESEASSTATDRSLTILYQVPAEADQDFTIAVPALNKTENPVTLSFRHMLSRILITVKLDTDLTDTYILESNWTAELGLLYDSGTIDATIATSNTSTAWNPANTDNDLTMYSRTFTEEKGCHFTILPQPLMDTPTPTMQIKDVTINSANGNPYFSGDLKLMEFTSTNPVLPTILGPGTQYNIEVTITHSSNDDGDDPVFNGEITYSSSTTDWTTVDEPID